MASDEHKQNVFDKLNEIDDLLSESRAWIGENLSGSPSGLYRHLGMVKVKIEDLTDALKKSGELDEFQEDLNAFIAERDRQKEESLALQEFLNPARVEHRERLRSLEKQHFVAAQEVRRSKTKFIIIAHATALAACLAAIATNWSDEGNAFIEILANSMKLFALGLIFGGVAYQLQANENQAYESNYSLLLKPGADENEFKSAEQKRKAAMRWFYWSLALESTSVVLLIFGILDGIGGLEP